MRPGRASSLDGTNRKGEEEVGAFIWSDSEQANQRGKDHGCLANREEREREMEEVLGFANEILRGRGRANGKSHSPPLLNPIHHYPPERNQAQSVYILSNLFVALSQRAQEPKDCLGHENVALVLAICPDQPSPWLDPDPTQSSLRIPASFPSSPASPDHQFERTPAKPLNGPLEVIPPVVLRSWCLKQKYSPPPPPALREKNSYVGAFSKVTTGQPRPTRYNESRKLEDQEDEDFKTKSASSNEQEDGRRPPAAMTNRATRWAPDYREREN
ncbi:hypothetical protein M5K25_012899 [Dendrobium thyrsiflorum]|uniref:Uncharacterized protein n=1 Tax=Dendrobium thyrsiflorum TaxID=117978 RepID=A0ABD0UYA9_DENTH